VVYIIASFGCAASWGIWPLIVFRILQAAGGSAASAVSMAMVKDLYERRRQESVLAIVQSMVVITSAVAPILGASMLPYTSWRGLFLTLAFIGVVSFIGGRLLEETAPSRSTGSVTEAVRRLGVVLSNPRFTYLRVIFSLVSTASLAFVLASSYIYPEGFGLSEQWYSLYFALNAVALIWGPFLYLWLTRRVSRRKIVAAGFAVMAVSGLLVCLFGVAGPLRFALALLPASLMGSSVRPEGAFLMLDQQREDTGSASALINSAGLVLVFLAGK